MKGVLVYWVCFIKMNQCRCRVGPLLPLGLFAGRGGRGRSLAAVPGFLAAAASLVAVGHEGFSGSGLESSSSAVVAYVALVAPWHVESSWPRDRTHVSCTCEGILHL